MRTILSGISVPAVMVSVMLAASACDDTFDPFLSGAALRYSIFGYLNAAADTQWIRVTPIRESVFTEPGDLDATVTLEHTGTGQTILLHDSIFRYATAGPDGGAEAWAHNFWTDAPIAPSTTYKLSVVAADGATTEAMIPVPGDLPEIVIETRIVGGSGGGRGGGGSTAVQNVVLAPVENLAMVRVIHYVADRTAGATTGTFIDCPLPAAAPRVYSLRQPLGQATTVGGVTELVVAGTLNTALLMTDPPATPCVVARREVLVASSGSSWPTGVQFSAAAPAITEAPSAVEGGVGFVGGVVTRTVPFENCAPQPRTAGAVCAMRYNDRTLTIEGTVIDSFCQWGVEGAAIQLTELDDAGNPVVIRTTSTDQDGHYRIGALVGGTNYSVFVTQPLRWAPDDPFAVQRAYLDFEDIVMFGPAQTVSYDIILHRQVPCVFVPE